MVLEIGVNGVTAARYLRGLELIAREQDGKREYYHQNGHGDIILRMDAWGNALKAYEYDAFGVEQEREKLDTNPFRYCGEYWDEETETIYLRARNYRPAVGSFWSEDPIRDGLHWYAYCAGNPVSFVDPSGMEATQDQGWLEKTLNGIRDVLDYLTLGTISASEARSQAMLNDPSFYTIGNWLTLGLFDTVKGTFAPEEPLSLQHWMDSLGTATLVMGIWESVSRLPKRTKTQTDAQNKSSSVTQGMTESGSGVLDNANYAQKTYSNTFSPEGVQKYSNLAGEPINTIDDLVNAIHAGKVNVSDLPVEYIVRDGNTLILNTRTSQALTQAGIPRSQWNAINRTGDAFFEDLLSGQLSRNNLTSEGISTVRPSGGR